MSHSTAHGHGASHEDLERGNHQEDSLDFSAIIKAGVGLVVVTAATYVTVLGIYALLNRVNAETGDRRYPMATGQPNRLPPEPRLQTDPKQDLHNLRAAEADVLEHYGWVDRNAGVVRIPIENAMKLTVERGLPSRPASAPSAAAAPPAAPPPVQASDTPRQERK